MLFPLKIEDYSFEAYSIKPFGPHNSLYMNELVHNDINNIYYDILKELFENGKLNGKRKGLPFVTFTLTDLDRNVTFFPFAQRNWPWILRECSDRLFGIPNPGLSSWYSKNWENRKEDSGLYSYHYSDRMNGQMEQLLRGKLNSEDKILQVWAKGDYSAKGRRPCTIIMQPVMECDGRLSMIVYMRSNDMINLFPSDIFIHSTYLKYWATKKKIPYGNIYWVAAKAYYQKKRDKLRFIERLLEEWENDYEGFGIEPTRWTNRTLEELDHKEEFEQRVILAPNPLPPSSVLINEITSFNPGYVREWYKLMLLAQFKKLKMKDEFQEIFDTRFTTEFGKIKEHIKY